MTLALLLRVPRRAFVVSVLIGVGLCAPNRASDGQTAAISDVKAAFIFNFAKFTTWPSDPHDAGKAPAICVMGDNAIARALLKAPTGAVDLSVRIVRPDDSLTGCHVLYVSTLDAKAIQHVVSAVCTQPVLTVSDSQSFTELGGIAELMNEGGHIRFAINVEAARRANLTLSSRMLSLAKIVKEERRVQP